ncbi:hypothetical protein CVT24_009047 [Panaeolus cyanescens]|uniref:Phosphatidylinositol-specific phospholipase C X domain-containing protein n=1 Tax=Panaeolus cyanescens TaxID=181874 RepID=A0A409YAK2_9AGAR|nr:hypothetical protein CVT24_009047 [Panaeolus cyanescens]
MRPSLLALSTFAATVSATGLALTQATTTLKPRATVCNGHAELCDRSFGSVSFVGAHNSYAIGVNNAAVNQGQSVMQQLNDGIRMLQMQAHNENGVIRLCHSLCQGLLDGGSLEDYLKIVKQWMDANPNEVLSLLIVNIDNVPATAYDPIFKSVGLDTMSFAPPSSPIPASGWPTLGSMIDSGKRLVTFLDNAADLTAVPYLIDEFTNIWETEFNVLDPAFDCNVNRTKGDPATQMYLINHFLDTLLFGQPIPFIAKLNDTNAASGPGSLGAHVDTCVADHGRPPNFMLVDFYEFGGGSVFQVAATINGVTYNPSTPIAKPLPTDAVLTTTGGTGGSVTAPTAKTSTGSAPSQFTSFSANQFYAILAALLSIFIGPLTLL